MTRDTFIQNFEYLADARNGVQRLRELIFQLAVQGRLVSQDTNDEPVSVLLNRIEERKQRPIKEGRVRRQDSVAAVKPSDVPYELPSNWLWVRVDSIANRVQYGYTASARESRGGVLYLRITDIQNDTVDWSTVPECTIDEKSVPDYELSEGDILIARTGGTIGKSYLVGRIPGRAVFASYLIRIVPSPVMCAEYLKIFLGSPLYWSQLYEKSMGTGQPNVNGTALRHLILPLPPLAEQERIVDKVNELMNRCDELDARQKEQNEQRTMLTASCLHTLTSAPRKSAATAIRRVSDNFNLLIDTPESVAEFRKAILQLAVQGRLVPQDPAEGDASVLLELVRKQKNALSDRRRAEELQRVGEGSRFVLPHPIPEMWTWTRMQELSLRIHYGYTASGNPIDRRVLLLRITDIQNDMVDWDNVPGCMIDPGTIPDYELHSGDILVARTGGTIGKSYLVKDVPSVAVFASYLIRIVPSPFISAEYLKLFLGSETYWRQLHEKSMGTGQPNVNGTSLRSLFVPLPPLPEQERIVFKVNKLMGLCNELESKLSRARDDGDRITSSFVYHLFGLNAVAAKESES
jgi:type I restriction enzyme, S subunit